MIIRQSHNKLSSVVASVPYSVTFASHSKKDYDITKM